MESLNDLELAVLKAILEDNKGKYPLLKLHLPYLRVKNREYTGVGIYINFVYNKEVALNKVDELISSPKRLMIDELVNELTYVLDITDGKINYLEIVTNGNEMWDGSFMMFNLI